ncbi:MAG TPA: non-heme iron oxygenase ferredoxin subunit [Gammaproteobacteria bacterium]|nr:non-heme iron oxygenase ferredoxin subunit [Gammaproteobacteria bacterium]
MTDWIDIDLVENFHEGEARLVETEDTNIAVFNYKGDYYALEDVCTHDGSPLLGCGLDQEDLIDDDQIICPRHGARFCIKTGEALTPPAYEPTATFPVRIENGMVQTRDNRWDE